MDIEPTHNNAVRTTSTSQAEGRMKSSLLSSKKKRKAIYDGLVVAKRNS
jgi:hypothetical protein